MVIECPLKDVEIHQEALKNTRNSKDPKEILRNSKDFKGFKKLRNQKEHQNSFLELPSAMIGI